MANFGQLETTKGSEAAAFLNWATAVNKWVTIGRLLETTSAAKRPPS